MKNILLLITFALISILSFGQDIIITDISIIGNKKTNDNFIIRELLFSVGDTIKAEEWDKIKTKSENNLINTSLFLSANIIISGEKANSKITINIEERWYLFPIPQVSIDERNFNTWLETKNLARASAGVFLTHNNMRGRGEILKVLLMLGYNQKIGLSYEIPYLNKSKTFGIAFQSIYTLKHEVNAATKYDKQIYLKLEDIAVQRDWISALQFTYRPKHYIHHALQLRYHQWQFADSLLKFNPTYSSVNNIELRYFGFHYKLKIDHRNYKPYPLKGYYSDIEAIKHGLGIIDNNLNIFSLKSTSRKYFQIHSNWYAAIGLIAKYSFGKHNFQPYLLEKGIGYGRDYVRGYEYYVVDGQDYAIVKANIKYAILPKKTFKLNFIPWDKFNNIPISIYLNIFADAGYVSNKQIYDISNRLPNSLLYSGGLGIDLSTYYDAVARFEFALNTMGEPGVYLHFIAPI